MPPPHISKMPKTIYFKPEEYDKIMEIQEGKDISEKVSNMIKEAIKKTPEYWEKKAEELLYEYNCAKEQITNIKIAQKEAYENKKREEIFRQNIRQHPEQIMIKLIKKYRELHPAWRAFNEEEAIKHIQDIIYTDYGFYSEYKFEELQKYPIKFIYNEIKTQDAIYNPN